MKKMLIIMINLFCMTLFAQNKAINIYFHFTDGDITSLVSEYRLKIKSAVPFNEYDDHINLLGHKLDHSIVSVDKYEQPIYSQEDIRRNHPIESDLDIYIINDTQTFAKGGQIAGVPVIFAGRDITAAELLHETCHAIARLGDEYDTDMSITFSEHYVSKYPNLTLTYPVAKWEKIKKSLLLSSDDSAEKIGYYPGGLGSRSGIYRSYPTCLMRDLNKPLCPICRYYVRNALNDILNKKSVR